MVGSRRSHSSHLRSFETKPFFSPAAASLLRSLLAFDRQRRLGLGIRGSQEVMRAPFFKGVDWRSAANGLIETPFSPAVVVANQNKTLISSRVQKLRVGESLEPQQYSKGDSMTDRFRGFEYIANRAHFDEAHSVMEQCASPSNICFVPDSNSTLSLAAPDKGNVFFGQASEGPIDSCSQHPFFCSDDRVENELHF